MMASFIFFEGIGIGFAAVLGGVPAAACKGTKSRNADGDGWAETHIVNVRAASAVFRQRRMRIHAFPQV